MDKIHPFCFISKTGINLISGLQVLVFAGIVPVLADAITDGIWRNSSLCTASYILYEVLLECIVPEIQMAYAFNTIVEDFDQVPIDSECFPWVVRSIVLSCHPSSMKVEDFENAVKLVNFLLSKRPDLYTKRTLHICGETCRIPFRKE
ncbi:hypothetical protein SOVF_177060 [Spinacia oleracea]|uniref:Uncharacterized protein isoform X2 n=1 Tax=Spinacia oleracea TaxID=3562 RepID=A0ABM3RME0_SPIOL|nr:uncharacterized protein LOC110799007 isoform X2 [Spinacia oleracea]KNA06870.1 hypothetical protein SOVF_177060 [Spinacia oleracea]